MQTNVSSGAIRILAGQDLTDKNNYLVKMSHDTGVPEVVLPTHNSDHARYIVDDENTDGELVSVIPLEPGKTARIILEGTCNPGDVLVNADVATTADRGMVRVLPAVAGTYRGIAIAEEAGVDGQHVLVRAADLGNITVL